VSTRILPLATRWATTTECILKEAKQGALLVLTLKNKITPYVEDEEGLRVYNLSCHLGVPQHSRTCNTGSGVLRPLLASAYTAASDGTFAEGAVQPCGPFLQLHWSEPLQTVIPHHMLQLHAVHQDPKVVYWNISRDLQ
jgi:hypothetical protein